MKILFVNPSLRLNHPYKILPVGLAMVMTYIEKNGYEFDLYDIDINDISNDEVDKFIQNNHYDIILFGTIVTHYKWVKWFVNTIKKHSPKTCVIVGNSVAGSIPEVFLQNTKADVVVIGEGELTTLEVINAAKDKTGIEQISGIAYRNERNEIIKNPTRKAEPNIDIFPMIEWGKYFDIERYLKYSSGLSNGVTDLSNVIAFPISSARGCAFRCTFCHRSGRGIKNLETRKLWKKILWTFNSKNWYRKI